MKKFNVDFSHLPEHHQFLQSAAGESRLLVDKMHDLGLLFAEFDAELAKLYIDNEDHVVKLAEGAAESAYLRGSESGSTDFIRLPLRNTRRSAPCLRPRRTSPWR
ncbi:hypothetical protein HMSSN036_95540 [Paenibacillus macerans]|nr:hypothetical protein HMSSN036_95540 [Paenibacillus macerans]